MSTLSEIDAALVQVDVISMLKYGECRYAVNYSEEKKNDVCFSGKSGNIDCFIRYFIIYLYMHVHNI